MVKVVHTTRLESKVGDPEVSPSMYLGADSGGDDVMDAEVSLPRGEKESNLPKTVVFGRSLVTQWDINSFV